LVLSARTLTLAARRDRLRLVRRGRRLRAPRARLSGVIEAFSDRAGCEPGQLVRLQRRRPGRARYATFARVRSNGRGEFTRRFRARRTYIYRARVVQTSRCLGAVSERERINVLRPRRR
ncbi:MAG: hypothetical protein M3350_09375, partial [Actinomycetota bacterium]|nr:hypothetical protein [Actinomycetota bacterium]